jgi:spectinomycin phosphotransferase
VDDEIARAVSDGWGIAVVELQHLAVGAGAHHWRATAGDGGQWFVTVDDLDTKPWLGADRDAVFDGLLMSYGAAAVLPHAGLPFVLAPIEGRPGAPALRLDERHSVSVCEHVDGSAGQWGQDLAAARREELVTMLARLHLTRPPVSALQRPLALPGRGALEAALGELDRPWDGGPLAEPARRELAAHAAAIRRSLADLDAAAARLAADRDSLEVVTHGEPHPANLMETGRGLVLIDWDTVAVAPPERDLWMLGDDPEALTLYGRLTGIAPRPEAIAAHRLLWALTDVAAFVVQLRAAHRRDADAEHALQGLRSILSGSEPSPYGRARSASGGARC